ncbi:MAG: hypothetical protein ACP5PX_01565 [Candidatus Hadarchaeum sp.]
MNIHMVSAEGTIASKVVFGSEQDLKDAEVKDCRGHHQIGTFPLFIRAF